MANTKKSPALKILPASKWGIKVKDATVNGVIVAAVKDGVKDLDALVAYFESHEGLAPNKSSEYRRFPHRYISGYLRYLKQNSVIA
jgi:hypothetical protein